MPASEEPTPPRLFLGISLSLVAYLFSVIASSLVWEFGGQFPTVQLIFLQNCFSLCCILPIALRKGFKKLKTHFLSDHLIRDFFGVGSYFFYFAAIRMLNLVDATTLNYTAPFFVPVMWWIWMNQKVGKHVWWSILIGFVGVAIILNPQREIFQLGFVCGLLSGLTSAVSLCALRILNIHKEPMSRTLFYYFSIGTLLTFPFAWITWKAPSAAQWIGTLGIGIATAVAQILFTIAYRYGTASFLSPLGYATVIYAGLSSWLIFGVTPPWRSWIGTALIIFGGTMTYILKKRPSSIAQTFEVPNPKQKTPL